MKKVRVVTVVEPSDHEWLVGEVEREGSDMSTVLRRVISEAKRGRVMRRENRKWRQFDESIVLLSRSNCPPHLVDSLVHVNDTLERCAQAAESVFGDDATPELALSIYDRVEAERQRLFSLEP